MDVSHPEVLIIGGGPAGSTLATLLAEKGRRVMLVEKCRHPRFHIGESLLPMNMPLFERLGLLKQIEAIGVRKNGVDFAAIGSEPEEFSASLFSLAGEGVPSYAVHVQRDQLDQLLFEHSQTAGAQCLQETTVESVQFAGENPQVALKRNGESFVVHPQFVVDASGRDAFLASKNGWRKADKKHASAAIYAHFSAVDRRKGKEEGNISIVHFRHGWVWLIPLPNGKMSIGVTCKPEYLKSRSTDLEAFLWKTLRDIPAVAERIKKARVEGPVRVAANYSYGCDKIWGDQFAVIGDAAVFIDPVFSSGVFLAMRNAEDMASIVSKRLDGDLAGYRKACKEYEKNNKRALAIFKWFIYRFTNPAMQILFQNPRNIFGVQVAVISLLAGDVYGASQNVRKLWVFKCIYGLAWLFLGPKAWHHKTDESGSRKYVREKS